MHSGKTWLWLIPVLLVTFWIGAHYMDTRPVWNDELFSLSDTGIGVRSPADIWNGVAERNPWHPPGFFIVLNIWARAVGASVPALRLLSLMCGLLAVAFTYRLGRDTVSARVGLYGAVLLGTTVMFAYYLDQIRVYSMLVLLATLTLWLYLRVVRMQSRPRLLDWICLLLAVAGLLYSHYFGGIILAMIGLYHLLFVAKNRRWWTVVGVFALGGLLFLPWAGVLLTALHLFVMPQDYNDRALTDGEVLQALATLFSNGAVVLLVIVLVLAVVSRLRGGWRLWFFAGTSLAALLVVNALFRAIPVSRLRYLLMLWPLFALVAAMGLVWLGQRGRVGRWAAPALLLVWAGFGIANVSNLDLTSGLGGSNVTFPFQRVIRVVKEQVLANDLILDFLPQDMPFYRTVEQYYERQYPADTLVIAEMSGTKHKVDADTLASHQRLWLAYVPGSPVASAKTFSQLQSTLTSYAQCQKATDTADLAIVLYAHTPACCGPTDHPLARFGSDMIQLARINVPPQSGNSQPLEIGWTQSAGVPPNVYSATIQVFDRAGNKVGQKDYGLEPLSYSCPRSEVEISGLKPGTYDIRAGVYAWQTQERLPGVDSSGTQGDLLTVGTFAINS